MPETKFTPGPWIYDSYNDILAGSAQNDDLKIICSIHDHPDGESRYEAEQIVKRSAWYRESQANALLIAAAPSLLTALTRARDVLRDCAKDTAGTPSYRFFMPEVEKCNAAIAKALGERASTNEQK